MIIVINLVRSCLFILSIYLAQSLSVEVLCTSPRDNGINKRLSSPVTLLLLLPLYFIMSSLLLQIRPLKEVYKSFYIKKRVKIN